MNETTQAVVKPRRAALVWSALGGAVFGAVIAGAVVWLVMREREKWLVAQFATDAAVNLGTKTVGLAQDVTTFFAPQAADALSPSTQTAAATTPPAKNEADPFKEDLFAYAAGRTLPLPEQSTLDVSSGTKSNKSCVIKKDGLEAFSKGHTAPTFNGTQRTHFSFLYKADEGRYAVEANAEHRQIGDKTAFFDFVVQRVAKQ
jgi:hypothetical protein